jgi:PEP-CTERM motif-containing protein
MAYDGPEVTEMKKLLVLSSWILGTSILGVAGLASATTINVTCPTVGGSGASGTSTTTCNSAAVPVGYTSLTSIALNFTFDAAFAVGASGSVLENFDTLSVGPGDAFGGLWDHPTNQIVTNLAHNISGSFVILNPTLAQVTAALTGMQIASSWSSGEGSFASSSFQYNVDVTYQPGAPEPTTLGMLGLALAALGFAARVTRE